MTLINEEFIYEVRNLIVPIIEDARRHGLKVHYLKKHKKYVANFYNKLIDGRDYNSELALKYQKRFLRFRESLFLFIEEDGIPWNNNMAERAIRHLAVQRKISGTFYETACSDYLALLGVMQSCRFQDKSFFKFLLSGELDVDRFMLKKVKSRIVVKDEKVTTPK